MLQEREAIVETINSRSLKTKMLAQWNEVNDSRGLISMCLDVYFEELISLNRGILRFCTVIIPQFTKESRLGLFFFFNLLDVPCFGELPTQFCLCSNELQAPNPASQITEVEIGG